MDLSRAERALLTDDLPGLCLAVLELFPHDSNRWDVEDIVRFALDNSAPPLRVIGKAAIFLDSLTATKRLLQHGFQPVPPNRPSRHRFIGADIDFIADSGGIADWSIAQCLNYLLLRQIKPRRRTAVVGTMRDDGIYILDWIAHYRALGFEHIFLYTNDNADGSEALLRLLSDHNVITLIECETDGTVPPEGKAFGHALHLLHELRDFEWVLFVDSDEYLVLADVYANSVENVLRGLEQRFPQVMPAGICYDWLWFTSGMAFERTRGPLLERFQHARPHWLTKPLVRLRDAVSMRRQHFPEVTAGSVVVDSVFDPLDLTVIWDRRVAQYGGGRINHYWPRSFQEFAIKKARGSTLKLLHNLYDRPYRKFFEWNGIDSHENHFPPDPNLRDRVRRERLRLEGLEGAGAAAYQIEQDFPVFLERLVARDALRKLYDDSRTAPGPL